MCVGTFSIDIELISVGHRPTEVLVFPVVLGNNIYETMHYVTYFISIKLMFHCLCGIIRNSKMKWSIRITLMVFIERVFRCRFMYTAVTMTLQMHLCGRSLLPST
jgi:hypothetical protein